MEILEACLGAPAADVSLELALAAQERVRSRPPEDTFAWTWARWWEQPQLYAADLAAMRVHTEGRVLVDLASGRACLARPLVSALGCSAYVGVDVAHGGGGELDATRDLHGLLAPLPQLSEGVTAEVPVARVRADALDFAVRCRPGRVVFLVGGVDQDVVAAPAWHRRLAHVIAGTLSSGGVVLWTEVWCASWWPSAGLVPVKGLRIVREDEARNQKEARELGGASWLGTGVCHFGDRRSAP